MADETASYRKFSPQAVWKSLKLKKKKRLFYVDIGLRGSACFFSLLAFAVMAIDSKSAAEDTVHLSFSYFDAFLYLIAINVLVWMYSVGQIIYVLLNRINPELFGNSELPNFSSFMIDLILSYLLISCSSSAATEVQIAANGFKNGLWISLCQDTGLACFCTQAQAAVVMSFLVFFILGICTILSATRWAITQHAGLT